MEITMDMYESKIDELMNEYYKVSGIGTEHFNPTFFELFMTLIDFFYIEEVFDVKGNIIVASIFELFCDINKANIDILHEAFSKLRVKTKMKRVNQTKPEILLNAGLDTIQVGVVWEDAGATVSDNSGETLTITVAGTVDINTAGEYEITYTAEDSSGNIQVKTRYVNVVE